MIFDDAIKVVLEAEGIFSNNQYDSGGKTKYGVIEETWKLYGNGKPIEDITVEDAIHYVYKPVFWDGIHGNDIPDKGLAILLFDSAVNHWVNPAVKLLQEALNATNGNGKRWADISVDGVFGEQTMDAIFLAENLGKLRELFIALYFARGKKYMNIVEKNPTQREFTNGWLKRLFNLSKYVPN